MKHTSRLILVGGFLGAGKTTLLWEAAEKLMRQGKRVGLITNDQAPELVDTALLLHKKVEVAEVSGSCFCCNFNGLVDAVQKVKAESEMDIIIAEPVGSCTDLSATILQPLKAKHNSDLLLSPLTVMADPVPLTEILFEGNSALHPGAVYIYLKQLEESDIILISKSDLLTSEEMEVLKMKVKERFPLAEIRTVSMITGEGIEEWLNEVLIRTDAGLRIVEVDYDLYAKGEAVLGWLNSTIELSGDSLNWDLFVQQLMADLCHRFEEMKAPVGHVKIMIEAGTDFMIGNLTGEGSTLNFRGSVGTHNKAHMTINARVQIGPHVLEQIVRKALSDHLNGKVTANISAFRCLSPGRPSPTFRFNHVVPTAF